MSTEQFFEKVLSVRLTEDRRALDIIDQTLLPGTIRDITARNDPPDPPGDEGRDLGGDQETQGARGARDRRECRVRHGGAGKSV